MTQSDIAIVDQLANLHQALSVQDVANAATLQQSIVERLQVLYTAAEQAQSAELMTQVNESYNSLVQLCDSFGAVISITGGAMRIANLLLEERDEALKDAQNALDDLDDLQTAIDRCDFDNPAIESLYFAAEDSAYEAAYERAEENLEHLKDETWQDGYDAGYSAGYDDAEEAEVGKSTGEREKYNAFRDAITALADVDNARAEALLDALLDETLTPDQSAALDYLLSLFGE